MPTVKAVKTLADTSTCPAASTTKPYSSYVGILRGAGQNYLQVPFALIYKILTSYGQEGSPHSKYRKGGTKWGFL